MPIFDLFSKRAKRARNTTEDIYQYDAMPKALKTQFIQICGEVFDSAYGGSRYYELIVRALIKEYGVFTLVDVDSFIHRDDRFRLELWNFFLDDKSLEHNIDVVELTFNYMSVPFRQQHWDQNAKIDGAIMEFNGRCKEAAFGYEYIEGQIVRIDSELIHSSAVIPLLAVFRRGNFDSARDEFLAAHEHYRNKNYQQSLVDALKSFESTMKIICDRRGWSYNDKKGASELVRACLENGLIPNFWATHFNGLRSVLESGIPTPRNRIGGHGAGSAPVPQPPEELVAYVLHMTASTILYLSEADAKLPRR